MIITVVYKGIIFLFIIINYCHLRTLNCLITSDMSTFHSPTHVLGPSRLDFLSVRKTVSRCGRLRSSTALTVRGRLSVAPVAQKQARGIADLYSASNSYRDGPTNSQPASSEAEAWSHLPKPDLRTRAGLPRALGYWETEKGAERERETENREMIGPSPSLSYQQPNQ